MRILTRCTLRACVLVVAPLVKLERPSCVTRLDAISGRDICRGIPRLWLGIVHNFAETFCTKSVTLFSSQGESRPNFIWIKTTNLNIAGCITFRKFSIDMILM